MIITPRILLNKVYDRYTFNIDVSVNKKYNVFKTLSFTFITNSVRMYRVFNGSTSHQTGRVVINKSNHPKYYREDTK